MSNAATRFKDFDQRRADNPHLVLVSDRGWEYIPIHPCADEHALLSELNWPAERCVSVDFYWRYGVDVAFVQVLAEGASGDMRSGIYARRADNNAYLFNIVAVLRTQVVTRANLREVMDRCMSLGLSSDGFSDTTVGPNLTYVAPLEDGAF